MPTKAWHNEEEVPKKKKRKKGKHTIITGNSRASSSRMKALILPTATKHTLRRDAEVKKAKSIKEIAKMLNTEFKEKKSKKTQTNDILFSG